LTSESNPEIPQGLLLSDDFLFNSRITGTAKALGLSIRTARSSDALLAAARQTPPRCVLVDLANPGLQIGDLIQSLRNDTAASPFFVAFGSHVDTATLKAAREAGCDIVLPRSKFVEDLPTQLPEWFAGNS
jgi:CheY-like chemotaxis protein